MNPQTMIIRFNCHGAGIAIITVRIEFEDDTLNAVQFRVAKDNVRMMLAPLASISRYYLDSCISLTVEQPTKCAARSPLRILGRRARA